MFVHSFSFIGHPSSLLLSALFYRARHTKSLVIPQILTKQTENAQKIIIFLNIRDDEEFDLRVGDGWEGIIETKISFHATFERNKIRAHF